VVLILRRVDRRHLAFSERVEKGVVDLVNREPKPSRDASIDDQICREPM
jgi:hypothetical protein